MIASMLLLAACGSPPPLAVPPRPADAPARAPWPDPAGYAPVPQGDGWLAASPALDLRAGITAQLTKAGVADIRHDDRCTIETPDLYSHRRDKPTGRFAGIVWLT